MEEFQRLCEVQSDKATIEITSRFKGKVLQILFVPGDIVKVQLHELICDRYLLDIEQFPCTLCFISLFMLV